MSAFERAREKAREAAVRVAEIRWRELDGNKLARRSDVYRAAISAYEAALKEEGMVVVPRTATPAMIASEDARVWVIEPEEYKAQCLARIWAAMVEAGDREMGR